MTPNQVELVAQAFYAAEYSGSWNSASEPLRAHFRNLASMAIGLLGQQMARCRSSATPAPMISSQADRREKAVPEIH
jgi:hypothetical protein